MPIIPRATPGDITRVGNLPQVRNDVRVDAGPSLTDAVAPLTRAGLELYEREKKRADATAVMQARRELSDWEASRFDPENPDGIGKYRGKDALGANDVLLPDLDKTVAGIRQRLSRDQQDMFDGVAFQFREGVGSRLQTYMRSEHERFVDEEQKATLGNLMNDATAAAARGDDTRAASLLGEALAVQELADTTAGRGEKVIAANRRAITSKFHAANLDGLMTRDPLAAHEYVTRNREAMLPEDVAKVERELWPLVNDGDARAAALAALDGGATAGGDVAPSEPEAIQASFRAIEAETGFRITSMVRPVLKVGAGARSQHPKGTAADFSVAGKSRAEIDALIARGRAAGFQVIDESDGKTGTGPHVHMELPPDAKGVARFDGAASTEGDAIARLASITDPRKRRLAEQYVRQEWSQRQQDKNLREQQTRESVYRAIEEAPLGANLTQALGPSLYAFAVENGMSASLDARLQQRREGTLVKSNPVLADALYRMAAEDPAGFAKQKVTILSNAHQLDTADYGRLLAMVDEVNKPGKQAEWATEAQRLDSAYRTLGYDKLKGAERTEREASFSAYYRLAKRQYVETQGKEPMGADADKLVQSAVRDFVSNPKLGQQARSAESFSAKLTPRDRARVVALLASEGITNPTELQIVNEAARIVSGGKQ